MEVDATALVGRSFGFRNDKVNLHLHNHSTIKWIDGSKIRIFAIHLTYRNLRHPQAHPKREHTARDKKNRKHPVKTSAAICNATRGHKFWPPQIFISAARFTGKDNERTYTITILDTLQSICGIHGPLRLSEWKIVFEYLATVPHPDQNSLAAGTGTILVAVCKPGRPAKHDGKSNKPLTAYC